MFWLDFVMNVSREKNKKVVYNVMAATACIKRGY